MQGTKEIDVLMQPVIAALNRRGIKGDARTDIYNRAYEALMISMDVKDALRAENERLRGFVAKLITKCEMPKNRDYHTMFQMCTMLDAIRIEALRVLHSEEDGNK